MTESELGAASRGSFSTQRNVSSDSTGKGHHVGRSEEFGGRWESVEEAIAWGRARAPRVYVDVMTDSLGVASGRYTAGEDPGDPDEGLPTWPAQLEAATAELSRPLEVAGDGGGVWIGEIEPSDLLKLVYDARCEREYVGAADWSPEVADALLLRKRRGLGLDEGLE
jgi:hypothetical protein